MPFNAKQQHELNVFELFVKATGLNIDSAHITQNPPPAPDIICKISENDYGFELTAITDKIIESKIGANRSGYSNFRIDVSDVVARIEKKSKNSYSISRVDLLLHEAGAPIDDLWAIDSQYFDSVIQNATDKSHFLRVWIVDFNNQIFRCYYRN